jgi:hypothetical protein
MAIVSSIHHALPREFITACTGDDPGAAALAWAKSFNIPVLPNWPAEPDGRCACGRVGCPWSGKHPLGRVVPHGIDDATTDLMMIQQWWAPWPDANPGLLMGRDVVALDIDPRHGGNETLTELQLRHGPLPATLLIHTGGGGEHRIFRVPVGLLLRSARLGPGVEFKGIGTQIIAAGSRHHSGSWYRIAHSALPVPLPQWVIELLRAHGESGNQGVAYRHTPRRRGAQRIAPVPHLTAVAVAEAARVRSLMRAGPHGAEVTGLLAGDPTANTKPDNSPSGADHRLGRLAKPYTRDPRVIEALIRSSGLNPGKYDRPDYLPRTIAAVVEDDPDWLRQQRTSVGRTVGRRGVRSIDRVMAAILRHLAAAPIEDRDADGCIRFPVGQIAGEESVHPETVRRAIIRLALLGVVSAPPVKHRRLSTGAWASDRFLVMEVPLELALAAVETDRITGRDGGKERVRGVVG